MLLKKIFCFIIVVLLNISCAIKKEQEFVGFTKREHGDSTKLSENKSEYGIVVLRSMFFANHEVLKSFLKDQSSVKLYDSNTMSVSAKNTLDNKYLDGFPIGTDFNTKAGEEKKRLFTIEPGKAGFFEVIPAIFKSDYFYTITMLKAGNYYISSISFYDDGNIFNQDFDRVANTYQFSVKTGQINYLGDLYYVNPRWNGKFFSSKYNISSVLLDKSNEARIFMKQFHPQINLPFTTNLIRRIGKS
jgi:hypothetical protein